MLKENIIIGKGAETMIELEGRVQKYSVEKHGKHLEIILERWDEMDEPLVAVTFQASKDIRDKYVLPKLAWGWA